MDRGKKAQEMDIPVVLEMGIQNVDLYLDNLVVDLPRLDTQAVHYLVDILALGLGSLVVDSQILGILVTDQVRSNLGK